MSTFFKKKTKLFSYDGDYKACREATTKAIIVLRPQLLLLRSASGTMARYK